MKQQKIKILLLILSCHLGSMSVDASTKIDDSFRAECYENYSKISVNTFETDTVYKIESTQKVNKIIQNGEFVPFQKIQDIWSPAIYANGKFDYLNDNNKKTYIEIDTSKQKIFLVELKKKTKKGEFNFMMDIDSKYHNNEISISDDWFTYTRVSANSIEDFWFNYLKINFIGKNQIEEVIKIRELSFQNKTRIYIAKSLWIEPIEFFWDFSCTGDDNSRIPTSELLESSIDTPFLEIDFIRNPNLDLIGSRDVDKDWVEDEKDNCINTYNPKQTDTNSDGRWDLCSDDDTDDVTWKIDNCVNMYNPWQEDINRNWVWDVCEFDTDKDTVPDSIDNCRNVANPNQSDADYDNIGNVCDNCEYFNPGQKDKNNNNVWDVCEEIEQNIIENDADKDGIIDSSDNCPSFWNTLQKDTDSDGVGDICDNCMELQNKNQFDLNENGVGDMCEDADSDNYLWYRDNCIAIDNPDQKDSDNDGIGDVCEDDDNDTVLFLEDNCPNIYNPNQKDLDKDGMWNACDSIDDRFLENNKTFFTFFLVGVALFFLIWIWNMMRKINK